MSLDQQRVRKDGNKPVDRPGEQKDLLELASGLAMPRLTEGKAIAMGLAIAGEVVVAAMEQKKKDDAELAKAEEERKRKQANGLERNVEDERQKVRALSTKTNLEEGDRRELTNLAAGADGVASDAARVLAAHPKRPDGAEKEGVATREKKDKERSLLAG